MSHSLRPHGPQPTRLLHPWDFSGKSTGVGCHCLLRKMKPGAAAAKSLQSCPTLCEPIDGSHQALPSLGFSRQERWSGLPFPSPMHESESEVAQSCPTLHDPMDCSPPGSSAHGIFQARVLEWGAMAFCRKDPEVHQIWTVNQASQNNWPKETWKKCPIKATQTATRGEIQGLSESACVSTHMYYTLLSS